MKEILRGLKRAKRVMLSRHLWFTRLIFIALLVLVFWGIFVISRNIFLNSKMGQYARMLKAFVVPATDILESKDGRTNILLLGIAGDGGKNPRVTDTIILASLTKYKATLVSVPRDIWIPEFEDKINSAYFRGNEKAAGGGLILTKSVVEEVLGQTVNYALALDFDGFVKVIDQLGGVEVEVERAFTDKRFPVPGKEDEDCGGDPELLCRYETVTFNAGRQVMDGETALKFSRSRHSEDPEEGTDLARAARQQKVLLAIKNAIVTRKNLLSPGKMLGLWQTFKQITETDLSDTQLAYVARLFVDARDNINSDTIPEDLLFSPPYSKEYRNLFVFVPKSGNWGEVHAWLLGVLN